MKPATTVSLIEFPCEFPIKAMGRADDDFDALVVSIIRRHSPEFTDATVRKRLSRGGKYVSVTVTIQAQSQEQLDKLYMELNTNEQVLMAL
ncbi:MAG: transcriptional regulator [Gammaproteobacteria bacterium RIFCSPLOWO2_01_FULL_47_190]|nr:MAG: transcriptional regulator [Gammaproteobacteria bacterium RIFCSPLOWO2_01_FULL_47_190]